MWEKFKIEFREQVWDNEQVLKLRQKFSELDTQTQSYIVIGAFSSFVFLLFISFIGFWVKTSSLKSEIAQMDDQIRYVQSSAVKIEELKMQARSQSGDSLLRDFDISAPISSMAERATQKALIPKGNVEIADGKGNSVDIKLNKISLRQLVRMLYLFEQSQSGAVVDKLSVDSKDDAEGYLWVSLSVRKEIKKGAI